MSTDLQKTIQGYIEIIELSITNFAGKTESLVGMYDLLEIQEDIFSPICSGSVRVLDMNNVFEDLPIVGEETIRLTYKDEESAEITREFVVFSISDKVKYNGKGSVYTINFCSEEMMYNRVRLISRAFTNMSCSDIVKKVLAFDLNSTKSVVVEDTMAAINYIAPTVHPFAVITSMASRAFSTTNKQGSLYLFFEDRDGFKFLPIETLIKGVPLTYRLASAQLDIEYTKDIVISHSFVSPVNNLENIMSGGYGANIKVLDLDNKQLVSAAYDYFDDNQYMKEDHVNGSNPNYKLTTSKFKYKSTDGLYRVVVGADVNRDNALAKRHAKLSAFINGPKVVIEVPFSADITVGKMVDIHIPNSIRGEEFGMRDEYSSGRYLATAVRHIIGAETGTTSIELVRDTWSGDHEENLEKSNKRLGI